MAGSDAKLKQRVVGAIVLAMLAILILPMLLDGSAKERERVLSQLPAAPNIESEDISVDEILINMEKLERESENQMPSSSLTAIEVEPKKEKPANTKEEDKSSVDIIDESLALKTDGLPMAWSLQVASFSNRENALALREKLRKDKHQSFIYKVDTDKGEVFRVFIGPVLSRTVVDSLQVAIKEKYKLEARVVKYNVAEDRNLLGG